MLLEKEEEYLKVFLKKIESKSENTKYKRLSISPLRYAGGKSKAIGILLENMPKLQNKKVVSPFFGGGSFELVLSKELGFEVIGYDIFELLTNFWNQLIINNENLIMELKKLKPNKEEFTRNRHILLNYWDKIKPSDLVYNTRKKIELNDTEKTIMDNDLVKRAAYYYYNMQLSYGPMFLGWPSSVYLKEHTYEKIINRLTNINLGNIKIFCDDFENVIKRHNNDFLFLDPPYYLGNDSKMFKGLYPNCNFAIHHNNFDHEKLCELLKEHKGGFMLTYNKCPKIEEMYKEYRLSYPSWSYTYGQGEKRIGKNRIGKNNIKESHEILIVCDPIL